jgi:hypothetical protein
MIDGRRSFNLKVRGEHFLGFYVSLEDEDRFIEWCAENLQQPDDLIYYIDWSDRFCTGKTRNSDDAMLLALAWVNG